MAQFEGSCYSENLNVHERTVHRVRQRYAEEGFEAALYRKPHKKHKPRTLDGDGEARLIALCCGQTPSGRKSWTLQLLADELIRLNIVDQISSVTVYNTLKKMNLSLG